MQGRHLPVSSASSVADALRGAWRPSPPPLSDGEDALVEPAIRGGAGALLARRVGPATTISTISRATLKDLVRHQVLEAARFERGLELRLRALAEVGLRPVVIKGWSIARRYPGKGLRHYSDLDLVVARDDVDRASAVLARFEGDRLAVDLHPFMPHIDGRDPTALAARLRPLPLGSAEVVTLGDEDHLWLLALHALGHGAWRPVWLCDLAVLIEERGRTLDWDYLFAGARRDVPAVKIALALAHRVLGAEVTGTPIAGFADELPSWVEPALQASWEEGYRAYVPLSGLPPPSQMIDEARRRWPNPIRATAAAHGPWNEWPRAPLQVLDSLRRAARFAISRDREAGIWAR